MTIACTWLIFLNYIYKTRACFKSERYSQHKIFCQSMLFINFTNLKYFYEAYNTSV